MINRHIRLDQRAVAGMAPTAVGYILTPPRVTRFERFLLVISVVMLPLQDYFPMVAGMSSSFLLFAALAAYVIINRSSLLGVIWCHPVFIAAYTFIAVSVLLEYSSSLSSYSQVLHFAQMIIGMTCVSVLCRDRSALAAGLYGYMATALWVSVVIYMTSYGMMQDMGGADDFHEAEKIRAQAFGHKPLGANINRLGFVCAQGTIVAFALYLSNRWKFLRVPLLGVVIFCLIATFLPMSRSAAVISFVAFAVIFYAYGVRYGKALIIAGVLGLAIYMLVPEAVWSRMMFSTDVGESGKMESRAKLYTIALDRLPEYFVGGVGAGNFQSKWGFEKWYTKSINGVVVVVAAHNTPIAILVYWGVISLLIFVWIVWCVYRAIPLQCGRDELSLALLGIIVSLGMLLWVSHNFADKAFALGVGMLIGARQWIWPTGIVSVVEGEK